MRGIFRPLRIGAMSSMLRPMSFAVSLSLLWAMSAAGAWAQSSDAGQRDVAARQEASARSAAAPTASRPPPRAFMQRDMSDSVRRVKESTGGQILGVERVPFEGRDINRVKYVDGKGRVRYMDDPPSPRTGGRRDGRQERPEPRRRDHSADP